jgi:hypothetical protein
MPRVASYRLLASLTLIVMTMHSPGASVVAASVSRIGYHLTWSARTFLGKHWDDERVPGVRNEIEVLRFQHSLNSGTVAQGACSV